MLEIGTHVPLRGDVSTLNWTGARPPSEIERNLGFGPGRLAAGYWVALLSEPLRPEDFEFGGTTLRSGGREGLPGRTAQEEAARPRVHDQILRGRGPGEYRALQEFALRQVQIIGPARICKIVPATGHSDDMLPAVQYPPGGGALQWRLVQPRRFLVAAFMAGDGSVRTPRFALSLDANLPAETLYENRRKLANFLAYA